MKYFPLFIQATNKTILIFGGGRDAAAKLRLVQKTEAQVLVVSDTLNTAEIQLGDAVWVQSDPLAYDFPANVAFAYAATGDAKLDAKIAGRARAAGVLVCAADQPDVSDFTTPALVDRDPVIVAIGTEGTAPVLARSIKADVEALLPTNLGQVAKLAASLRAWVADKIEGGVARRDFWQAFFKAKPLNFVEAAQVAENLSNQGIQAAGFISLVGAGPGDADLLTLKARKVLDRADTVIYDDSVSSQILELARREALMVPRATATGDFIQQAMTAGETLVWISAETPSVRKDLPKNLNLKLEHFELIPGVPVPKFFNLINRKAA